MGTKLSTPSKLQRKDMQSPKSPCASICRVIWEIEDEYKITSCIPARDKDSKPPFRFLREQELTVFITDRNATCNLYSSCEFIDAQGNLGDCMSFRCNLLVVDNFVPICLM